MFNEDGSWKEFSLIQNQKYTWFPLWLFCIVWAIFSYAIVKFLMALVDGGQTLPTEDVPKRFNNTNNLKKGTKMKNGYYVLNREATEIEGVPRYIYIGAEEPLE